MNFKTTLILLVLLAGVGIFVLVERLRSTDDAITAKTEETEKKLIDVSAADLERVTVIPRSGEKLVFERKGTEWRIIEPVQAAAETFEVDSLVREITELRSRNRVNLDPATTGLEPPRYRVELVEKGGKTHVLAVGSKSAIGDILYVRVGDSDQADVVSAGVVEHLDRPVTEYRQARLIEATQDQIQSVTVNRPETNLKLEKSGADWKIVEPKPMPGDPSEVSSLLSALTGLSAAEFVAEDAAKAKQYGLDQPTVTVTFAAKPAAQAPPATQGDDSAGTQADDSAAKEPALKTTTIKFGRYEDVLKKNVYALINNGPLVKVAASSVEAFQKSPLDLRDRKVLDIDPASVEKVTIERDLQATTQPKREASKSTIVLARREEKVEPAGPPAPQKKPEPQSDAPGGDAPPEPPPAPVEPDAAPEEQPAPADPAAPADAPSPQSGAGNPDEATVILAAFQAPAAQPDAGDSAEQASPADAPPADAPAADAPSPDNDAPADAPAPAPSPGALPNDAPAPAPESPPAPTPPAEAAEPEPVSEWILQSEPKGDAQDSDVQALLDALHPLRAQKYLESPPQDLKPVGTYIITITTASKGANPQQTHELRLTDPGPAGAVIGTYGDLTFEVDRSLLQKLEGDFVKGSDAEADPDASSFDGEPGLPPPSFE